MKILRIIARLNIGGPARNAVLLSEGLSGYPHGNDRDDLQWKTVLVCGEVGEGEGDMMWLAREKGIEPVIVPELGRELSFWDDWRAFWKIYRIICRERPDVIHTHTAKAGALGRMAGVVYKVCSKALNKPILVHTFHGHVLHSYFGRIKTFFFIWVEKILALFTDKIIVVSESLKKELVERFRIAPEKKVQVVELGFELDELLKLPSKEDRDVINIGIVGRLVAVKNHRMLLRVAQKIKAKFLIVGDGELRRELENYVRELGIEDIVEFKGWVKDLGKIYLDLDILVLTSLNEGTPVSIIEAMAAARPVVATNVGGVRDVVEDGKSGYLVGSGDEEKFSEKLLDLINHPEKRKIFGECGRKAVNHRFSKDRLIKDTEKLYNELLE